MPPQSTLTRQAKFDRYRVAIIALAVLASAMLSWPRVASADHPCDTPTPPEWCSGPPEVIRDAQFVAQSGIPRSMPAGHSVVVKVIVRNVGNVTWEPGAFKLGAQSPQDNLTWGPSRVELPYSVSPGSSATFTFRITAPSQPGEHTFPFQWRMLEEHVQWFGEDSPATGVTVKPHTWNLSDPLSLNRVACELICQPTDDPYGNPEVWRFLHSPSLGDHSPANHDTGLDGYLWSQTPTVAGIGNLHCWRQTGTEDSLPIVCRNNSGAFRSPFGINWAAGGVLMHPSPVESAVVSWRSPYTGRVRISGSVGDLHACGNGTRWTLWRETMRLASEILTEGAPPKRFSDINATIDLTAVPVEAGDRIYLEIDPRTEGDHACDSTGVELVVDA